MPMGGIGSIGQDPNQAAKLFAEKAGISIGEAKTALKEEFGDPVKDAAGSVFNFNMPSEGSSNIDLSSLLDSSMFEQNQSEQNGAGNFLQEIMNFFKGNNGSQKSDDSQEKGFEVGAGPQKPGDPQPHLGQMGTMQPQQGGNSNQTEEIKQEFNFFIEE